MTLTKDTLKELQKTEIVKDVQSNIDSNNGLRSTLLAVPQGVDIENIERYNDFRDSYRYKFETTSMSDFANYSIEFEGEGSKCFIDSENVSAKAVLDLGTKEKPLHQEHTATLTLVKTSAYNSILGVSGRKLSQIEASNFIEDWSDNIVVYGQNDNAMSISQSSKRVKEITLEQISNRESQVGDFSETQSSFEKIEAKNQETMPSYINFTCQPYSGLGERLFTLRLQILTGEDKPKISMRIVKLEAQKEDIAKEFKEKIQEYFKGTEISTFIGS
jgi:uncharacterized protein YfdQ (DUF2303 family)